MANRHITRAVIIITDGNRIVLVRRRGRNDTTWCLPGGVMQGVLCAGSIEAQLAEKAATETSIRIATANLSHWHSAETEPEQFLHFYLAHYSGEVLDAAAREASETHEVIVVDITALEYTHLNKRHKSGIRAAA